MEVVGEEGENGRGLLLLWGPVTWWAFRNISPMEVTPLGRVPHIYPCLVSCPILCLLLPSSSPTLLFSCLTPSPSPVLCLVLSSLSPAHLFLLSCVQGISEERIIEISSSSKHVQGTWLGRGMMHVLSPQVHSFTHFFHLTFLVLSPLV